MLKADLPYPTTEGIREDLRALRIVSPSYAGREGELTATLQYVYQSIFLGAQGDAETSGLLLGIAVAEMHHIELLGKTITALGAPPVFTACPPYPVGFYSASFVNYVKDKREMIAADICGEKRAIAAYRAMLNALENQKVSAIIERIIEDEKVHLAALEKVLSELCR